MMADSFQPEKYEPYPLYDDHEPISECCGSTYVGELWNYQDDTRGGMCRACLESAVFKTEMEWMVCQFKEVQSNKEDTFYDDFFYINEEFETSEEYIEYCNKRWG